ncbi:MAG: bifunctional folylpolyglutamate synthase/dihydrofolate synthase, partial [Verrucomicrobia bacterium]|nr:bifunctional folylpolyglutamate synthase/dihydrofolate synthase [Verrucomicrobiota bacterium]
MKAGLDLPEAVEWLYSTQWFGVKLGLEGACRLAQSLGVLPGGQYGPRVVHVAGTNGKGSTCAMLSRICRAQGWRTGLYTSPHLLSLKERFQIDGVCISDDVLCAKLNHIRAHVKHWDPHPTFFEIVTVLALDWFQEERTQIVVLETGMGGRLDATNILTPAVSVVTPVGLDHQAYLGDTLEKIAAEKAGIFKSYVPVVSAPQHEAVLPVLEAAALRLGCPFQPIRLPWTESPVALEGDIQRWNAALAVAALRAAGIAASSSAIAQGLSQVEWPGRFERIGSDLILDGAHNPQAARVLCSTWQAAFPQERASLIFGALEDKDVGGLLEALAPIVASLTLVPLNNP